MSGPDSSTDFDRAGAIFADAINIAPPERPAFIAARCGDDKILERSIVAMVAQFDRLGTFLSLRPADRQSAVLGAGDVLASRFRILGRLGAGGMGEVYRAEDLQARDIIAIKTIRHEWAASPEALDRFRAELRQARRIAHPNVCKLFHFHVEPAPSGGELAFITMQFLDGVTLSERLSGGSLPAPHALQLAAGIGAGLDAAHAEEIVHRDLKPGNIMLVPRRDGSERPVIMDFGLSKDLTLATVREQTAETVVVGSPQYMAPEQFDTLATVTRAADLYGFGLIVWEMLTGKPPLVAQNPFQIALRRSLKDPPALSSSLPDAPPGWDSVFARALARDPAARFPSASAFLVALEAALEPAIEAPDLPAEPVAPPVLPPHRAWTRRAAILSGTTAFFLSSGYLFYRLYNRRGSIPNSPVIMLTPTKHDADQASAQFAAAGDLWLKSQLQQSSRIQILASRRIANALDRMRAAGMASASVADTRTARQIALREGARLILFSTLAKAGEDYTFHTVLELLDQSPSTPEDRWSFEARFTEEDGASVLASRIERLADQLRKQMGEVENDFDVHRQPAEELTTANWDALQAYIAGDRAWRDRKHAESLHLLESATTLDPGFALAWGRLADLRMAVGYYDAGFDAYSKAVTQVGRKNLTDPESLRIRGIFAMDREDFPEAAKIFASFRTKFAAQPLPCFYGADCARISGETALSIRLLDQAIEISPGDPVFLVQRALYRLEDGDFAGAARQLQDAAVHGPNTFSPRVAAGIALSALDLPAAERALNSIADDTERAAFLACFNAERGRFGEADRLLTESIASNAKDSGEWFSQNLLLAGVYVASGRGTEAAAVCHELLDHAADHQSLQVAAVLARAGDAKSAARVRRAAASSLGVRARWPIYRRLLAAIDGEVALVEGHAAEALAAFEGAGHTQDVNIWPGHLFRAATVAARFDVAKPLLQEIVENPGRWFVAAMYNRPCFLRSGLELALRTPGLAPDGDKFRALCGALEIAK
jgi:serine/threonine protein kinase